ncbi:MAG: hypothetical protein HDQ96_00445 [Lachnospiraceae bacterium]|nr:hypothetical protein [Lachnospiraceae bacterium]
MNYKKLVVIAAVIIIGMIFLYRIRERTNEEYVSIFLENREDFDYVAEMMKQWPDRSIIDLEDGISSEDQKIADEIENNIEFYEHLKNLHDLKEISDVVKWSDEIEFSFRKPPKNYHGGWYYWENTEEGGLLKTEVIDEHWTLEMLPNV